MEASRPQSPPPGTTPPAPAADVTRRGFLTTGFVALAGVSVVAAAVSPLRNLNPNELPTLAEFFQKHYQEMTPEDKAQVFARIREEVQRRHRVEAELADPPPLTGVEFVYGLNLSRCIGCRRCVHACVQENNQSRAPEIQYIRVLQMEKGSIDLESADHHYAPPSVPDPDKYYMPVQCHQCVNPPCVKVCPVEATWQEPDGITVIDYDWCIGCRYCEAACPYWARRFNFAEPQLPDDQINPHMAYLSNRPRHKGVMEKCTFCLQRTRVGRLPACLEVCPTGSRKFGNVLDPESEVAYILKHKRVYVLKEDVGTVPRFFYYFDERGSRYREPIAPQPAEQPAAQTSSGATLTATPQAELPTAEGGR
ncbi:MAG: 4Fe-4S dicluster domain-containing protein [Planctomycetota bacterium]|nr:4Fe-4S dicluster domain-containing protein [Planctomycetota bacterium]